MISIIVASVDDKLLSDLKKNIATTIGTEYEILDFKNSRGDKGLCQIYNEGSRLAKFPFVCFMHEDVEVKTDNWGQLMIETFRIDPTLGLLGVAGCSVRSRYLSNWNCHFFNEKATYMKIFQRFKHSNKEDQFQELNPENKNLASVVCIDGVWMFTKREVLKDIQFDEATFKAFHCYDIDFSLNVSRRYKVCVTYDISIVHFSEGRYDLTWLMETRKLHKKWNRYLPTQRSTFSKRDLLLIEKKTHRDFLLEFGNLLTFADFLKIIHECRIFNLSAKLYFTMLRYTVLYYIFPNTFMKKYGN